MKRKWIILLVVLVAAAAGAVYYFYFRPGRTSSAVSILTAKAQYGYIAKSVTATGTVQPEDSVSVGAQVSGVVSDVYADYNDVVKKGQLLARVDPSIINAQVQQSQASLSSMQSNLEYQQANFNRQSKLFNLGAISRADYELALSQYNSARASVANASAQLRLVKKNLYYTEIYSPINGVILNRNVSAGQTIASSFNAPTLFVIAKDLTKMQVKAAVDEADIGGVAKGQNVSFTVDAYPDDIFTGIVKQILLRPAVSSNVVTYITLISVENTSMKLKPGMTASISIYLEEDTNALLIPSRALSFKPDSASLKHYVIRRSEKKTGTATKEDKAARARQRDSLLKTVNGNAEIRRSYVWTRKGDTLQEKRIITGMNDDSNVKVIRGLEAGEEVITSIVKGDVTAANNNSQRSPFMPTMQRRPTSTGGRPGN